MTKWEPDLDRFAGPRYLAIARALEADREAGLLAGGERLPPQRELAWQLGLTLGTVTRGYAEAERRGLIYGEVGRGTFVRPHDEGALPVQPLAPALRGDHTKRGGNVYAGADLAMAIPPPVSEDREVLVHLARLAKEGSVEDLLHYQSNLGNARARAAGASWLHLGGLEVSPANVAVTCGAQHGLVVALAAATKPGGRILAEKLTYAGLFGAAELLGRKVEGLAMDEEGILPGALAQSLRGKAADALYCVPTLQNPTGVTQSKERREAIAEICRQERLVILEDDVFAYYRTPAPPPFAILAPDITFSLTSLSKTVSPGLRTAYLTFPASAEARVASALRSTAVMAPPLLAELAAELIENGTAGRLLHARRREAEARAKLLGEILGPWRPFCPEGAITAWLSLPEPWQTQDFVLAALREGVAVSPAEHFTSQREAEENAVRISLGPPESRENLAEALKVLARLLAGSAPIAAGRMVL